MGQILTKDKIVTPGQILAEGMDYLPSKGTIRDGENIVSTVIGLLKVDGRVVNVIPLNGPYIPKDGDMVIGKIKDIGFSGWHVDIGSAYNANLSLKDATSEYIERDADLTQFYTFEELIFAKVTKVVRSKIIDLTMRAPGLRKLEPGRILNITSVKVPRVIGKQGSMISLIKDKTKCNIIVGQNGKVWIKGENVEDEIKAEQAILKIEEEAHTEGLTEKIEKFL
jgi:exosome complex component RRP4